MSSEDDDELFRQAMGGVEPLRNRDRVRTSATHTVVAAPAQARPHLIVEDGEGRAPGVTREQVARLRSGSIPPQRTIDLHGLRATVARDVIIRRIRAAVADGIRCVLIIHGRGKHSGPGGAVLGRVAAETLASAAIARSVQAFCRARPEDGGAGALYVQLR
jgi:DNA-nicking Smr family endonuclease